MARPRKYKDTEEAYKAQLERNKRYNDEKTYLMGLRLPKEYKPKLEYISKEMNISQAAVIKMCIDRLYSELKEKEPQQPSPEESDT